jgi:hypothetical protein
MLNRLSNLSFRTRSAGHDRDTDRKRHERLVRLLDEIVQEITSERRGLQRRYDEACRCAGFALDDDSPRNSSTQARVNDLSTTVMACEHRLATLTMHLESLAAAKADIGALAGVLVNRSP